MKRYISVLLTVLFLGYILIPANAWADEEIDVRVFLKDGKVFSGQLIESGPELIIIRINREIHVFEAEDVVKVVTLESLGKAVKIVPIWTFPRLGFLGGAFTGGAIATWAFDRASDEEREADDQARLELFRQEEKLRDEAKTARFITWGATGVGVICLVVALIPEREEKRVFPDHVEVGPMSIRMTYAFRF